jgi:Domain of unknown function (DUF4377)
MRNARVILVGTIAVLLAGCNPVRHTEKTVYVSSQLVSQKAQAFEPQSLPEVCRTECLEVRDAPSSNPYFLYQAEIKGFSFQAGYSYKLRVQISSSGTGISAIGDYLLGAWTLLETLEKTPAQ